MASPGTDKPGIPVPSHPHWWGSALLQREAAFLPGGEGHFFLSLPASKRSQSGLRLFGNHLLLPLRIHAVGLRCRQWHRRVREAPEAGYDQEITRRLPVKSRVKVTTRAARTAASPARGAPQRDPRSAPQPGPGAAPEAERWH